jgi:hypothetical protein
LGVLAAYPLGWSSVSETGVMAAPIGRDSSTASFPGVV